MAPIHLIGVELDREARNLAAWEVAEFDRWPWHVPAHSRRMAIFVAIQG